MSGALSFIRRPPNHPTSIPRPAHAPRRLLFFKPAAHVLTSNHATHAHIPSASCVSAQLTHVPPSLLSPVRLILSNFLPLPLGARFRLSASFGFTPFFQKTTGDPHTLGLHGDRFDNKGENNTVYCTFSSRDLHANVLFMYDTFLMGGTCANCMTKVVQGSFMKVSILPESCFVNLRPSN